MRKKPFSVHELENYKYNVVPFLEAGLQNGQILYVLPCRSICAHIIHFAICVYKIDTTRKMSKLKTDLKYLNMY